MPVVRISKGAFKPEDFDRVRAMLEESQKSLIPAIRQLPGCLHYWAAIDPVSSTMVNVSVWTALEDAKQMESLREMQALAAEFVKAGVQFERPIANYTGLWQI
jgi:quinol monooxygenase YgiN